MRHGVEQLGNLAHLLFNDIKIQSVYDALLMPTKLSFDAVEIARFKILNLWFSGLKDSLVIPNFIHTGDRSYSFELAINFDLD